ncbi:MAG: hypothetical protein E7654_03740 [Ruminococcaceae bacterium]|nr:hypothetical protein [Oscillospiraceae bacterium]
MKNKTFSVYCLLSLLGVLLASCYPIYMGVSVAGDMIRFGTVYAEDYPKYIIPYTPIALAVLAGVALMPLVLRWCRRGALLIGTAISTAVFFAAELLLERAVTVTRTVTGVFSTLEDWQMYMCYIPPSSFEERTWTEVDVLMGEYSPAFKLHFYLISVVLIISILNCFYGFARMILTGDTRRRRALILQAVSAGAFLGMCIWACFTAFYRNGDIQVSALSAVLMSVFFLLFGVTCGVYAASFLLGCGRTLAVWLPAASASAVTLLMYVGEMILLSGNLYRFGEGIFFCGLPGIVLAPVDILIVMAAGALAGGIAGLVRSGKETI